MGGQCVAACPSRLRCPRPLRCRSPAARRPSSARAQTCGPRPTTSTRWPFATLCLINNERAAEGLPALKEQAQLTQASTAYSQLMVDQHFFAHVTPSGVALTARLQASGYLAQPGAWTIGENIAWGESFLASPTNIVKAWMDSPPHRENILSNDFDEIGLGIVSGVPTSDNAGATYTTDFGRRTPAAADDQAEEVVADDTSSDGEPAATPAAKRQSTRGHARRAVRKAAKRATAQVRQAHQAGSQGALDARDPRHRRGLKTGPNRPAARPRRSARIWRH